MVWVNNSSRDLQIGWLLKTGRCDPYAWLVPKSIRKFKTIKLAVFTAKMLGHTGFDVCSKSQHDPRGVTVHYNVFSEQ